MKVLNHTIAGHPFTFAVEGTSVTAASGNESHTFKGHSYRFFEKGDGEFVSLTAKVNAGRLVVNTGANGYRDAFSAHLATGEITLTRPEVAVAA